MQKIIYQNILMNKFILFCISFTLIFASCKPGSNKDFSNISILVDEAEVVINKYDNNVQSALDSKKYDYIKVVSQTAMDSSNVKINDLKNLIIPPPAEELRISAIAYIKSLQKIINAQEMYTTITDTTSTSTAKNLDSNFLETVEHAKRMRDTYVAKLNALTN